MAIRVLVLEPDELLLESFQNYFDRATDFDTKLTSNGDHCIELLRSFSPHVLLMEPALSPGVAQRILDAVSESTERSFIPVLILTRFSRHASADHPSVKEFLVKPQSFTEISNTIRRLAAGKCS